MATPVVCQSIQQQIDELDADRKQSEPSWTTGRRLPVPASKRRSRASTKSGQGFAASSSSVSRRTPI
jgi:hypothetical protein